MWKFAIFSFFLEVKDDTDANMSSKLVNEMAASEDSKAKDCKYFKNSAEIFLKKSYKK